MRGRGGWVAVIGSTSDKATNTPPSSMSCCRNFRASSTALERILILLQNSSRSFPRLSSACMCRRNNNQQAAGASNQTQMESTSQQTHKHTLTQAQAQAQAHRDTHQSRMRQAQRGGLQSRCPFAVRLSSSGSARPFAPLAARPRCCRCRRHRHCRPRCHRHPP